MEEGVRCIVNVDFNPPWEKRWRLYILPQYRANLTQPIKYKESHICNICPCANDIVYGRFKDVRILLHSFPTRRSSDLSRKLNKTKS